MHPSPARNSAIPPSRVVFVHEQPPLLQTVVFGVAAVSVHTGTGATVASAVTKALGDDWGKLSHFDECDFDANVLTALVPQQRHHYHHHD